MKIGLYQSASALSALENWQESVAQNITSSQTPGYRKRSVNFSAQAAGEIQADPRGKTGSASATPLLFPKVSSSVNFMVGEAQQTRRELDVALRGEGFFEVQMEDGSRAYTRAGAFTVRADRTLVTPAGHEVMSEGGSVSLIAGGGPVTINRDGTMFQGENQLGKLSIQKFADPTRLTSIAGGLFVPSAGTEPESVGDPELLQGYLEGSNVAPLREMVDLVLISRAYEANQKIITTLDQQMQKTLEVLG